MKTIKDTAGREKETSPTHKVVFNQIQNRINDEHKEIVEEMCKKLLANLVIENYKIIDAQ